MHGVQDFNLRAAWHAAVANRWLAVRLEVIGNVLVLGTAILVVFEYHQNNISPGLTFRLALLSMLTIQHCSLFCRWHTTIVLNKALSRPFACIVAHNYQSA